MGFKTGVGFLTFLFTLLFSQLSSADCNPKEVLKQLRYFQTPLDVHEILCAFPYLTEEDVDVAYSRLASLLTKLPDTATLEELKTHESEIEVLLQIFARHATDKAYYSRITQLDNLMGRKLYKLPRYQELWFYQLHLAYLMANRELVNDDGKAASHQAAVDRAVFQVIRKMSNDFGAQRISTSLSEDLYLSRPQVQVAKTPDVGQGSEELSLTTPIEEAVADDCSAFLKSWLDSAFIESRN